MEQYLSQSEEQTFEIAENLAHNLNGGEYICFFGGLGAGKTAFTKGVAAAFDVKDRVTSPTFAIVHEYIGSKKLYHFDMYRIQSEDDLYSTGFYDYMDDDSIFLIEWSENIEFALPDNYIKVTISYTDCINERNITIERVGE